MYTNYQPVTTALVSVYVVGSIHLLIELSRVGFPEFPTYIWDCMDIYSCLLDFKATQYFTQPNV